VIDSVEQLFREWYDRDVAPLYRAYRDKPAIPSDALLPKDRMITRQSSRPAGRLAGQ
jgi:hypothetical protein